MKRVLLLVLFFSSCKSEPKSKVSVKSIDSNNVVKQNDTIKKQVRDCIPKYMDTIGKVFYVSYIDSGSFYAIKLGIDNTEKVLDYRFNCSTPEVVVPTLKYYFDKWLCLERGCSNNCVIYYLYKQEGNTIKEIRSFDQAYDINLNNSYCVVIDQRNYAGILIIDYFKNKCLSKALKEKKNYYDILDVRIAKNKVDIVYNDSSRQVINFSRSDFTDSIPEFVNADPPPSIEK